MTMRNAPNEPTSARSDAQGSSVIADLKREHEGWTPEISYVLDSTPAAAVEQRDLYDRYATAPPTPTHPPTPTPRRAGGPSSSGRGRQNPPSSSATRSTR